MKALNIAAALTALLVPSDHASSQTYIDDTGEQITAAEKTALSIRLRLELVDPVSAQIAEVRICHLGAYIGSINAKNSYGAYTGFLPFVAVPSQRQFYLYEDGKDLEFKMYAAQFCSERNFAP